MRRLWSIVAALALVFGIASVIRAEAAPRSALAALSLVLPEVKFDGTRFTEAVDYLREVSGANFHVDWKALESVGVTRDTPVSITARKITLRKTLSLMLAQTANPGELSFYNDGGVIEITTKALADDVLITRVYDVNDLLVLPMNMSGGQGGGRTGGASGGGISTSSNRTSRTASRSGTGSMMSRSSSASGSGGDGGYGRRESGGNRSRAGGAGGGVSSDRQALADDLVQLIKDTIEPDIWQDNGGTSSIRAWRSDLIITAPRRIHERIGGEFE